MNDENLSCSEGVELNLHIIFQLVLDHLGLLLLAAVLGAGITAAAASFLIPTRYQSSVLFYVNNSGVDAEVSSSVSSGDLSTSRNLVDSYIVILKTREALLEVLQVAGLDIPYLDLEGMISASAVNKTEFFRVTVTGPDPYQAEKIANAIGQVLPGRISAIIEGTRARVVEPAVAAWKPISLGIGRYGLLGCLAGVLLTLGALVLRELWEGAVWDREDIRRACSTPVLAWVPREGGWEAYRPACGKLGLAFAQEHPGRVLGVLSLGAKNSLAAVDLARALCREGQRVLLVEGDLARPVLAAALSLKEDGGLSEFLAGQREAKGLFYQDPEAEGLTLIPSGPVPPDPGELLGSVKMAEFLEEQRRGYDRILLDLGPEGLGAKPDGVLIAVTRRKTTRRELKAAVRAAEERKLRVLGILALGMGEKKA